MLAVGRGKAAPLKQALCVSLPIVINMFDEKSRQERKGLYEKVNMAREKHGLDPIPYSEDSEIFYCSFCGKEPEEIQTMIKGVDVFICNECIVLSHNLIHED